MPPKAKKKMKESAEQRRAREQMQAVAAAEGESQRRAAAASAMRQRAAREAQLTAVNSRRLDAEWLQRMRATKLEELQAEAAALSKAHDAQVDRYDRLIEALLDDIAIQNGQHDTAAAAHADVLESLRALAAERAEAAHKQFLGDLQAVQDEFESEKADMISMHSRHKKELADVAVALAAAYAETRAEAAASYRLMEEELKNRASEGLNMMKLSLEGRVWELQGALEAEHKSYVEATGAQEAAYQELAVSDAEAAAAIEQRTARLRQLQETLAQWRGRVVTNSNEWQRRNMALAREKDIVLGHHTALKGALAAFRRGEEARLKQMCVSYAAVEAELKQHLETAQRIIRLAQLTRRHELPGEEQITAAAQAEDGQAEEGEDAGGEEAGREEEEEEVEGRAEPPAGEAVGAQQDRDAFSADRPSTSSRASGQPGQGNSLPGGLPAGKATAAGEGGTDELGLAPGSAQQRLVDAFLQRMSGAALDVAALNQERLRLSAENATLRAVVAAVQGGTTVGPGTVDDPLNTLLMVGGRLQRELGAAAVARKVAAASAMGGSSGRAPR